MNSLSGRLENLLFASGDGLLIDDIAAVFNMEIAEAADFIEAEILRRAADTGLVLMRFGQRIVLTTRSELIDEIIAVVGVKNEQELSRSMMETIAIVAYRQPVTRAEIEQIRGVNANYCVNVLLESGLIAESGRSEAVGRPILFSTTDKFLRHFGIGSIENLPELPSVSSKNLFDISEVIDEPIDGLDNDFENESDEIVS